MTENISINFIDVYKDWREFVIDFGECCTAFNIPWIESKGLWNDKPIEAFRWTKDSKQINLEIRCVDGEIKTLENADTHTLPAHMDSNKLGHISGIPIISDGHIYYFKDFCYDTK